MDIQIRKYDPTKDLAGVLKLIRSEGEEWKEYLDSSYSVNLERSLTYVAYSNDVLCGYLRSMIDAGFFIWAIDLLVEQNYRGNAIGKMLLESMKSDYPNLDVYIMSDVDRYYEKLGYTKEGSIFKMA